MSSKHVLAVFAHPDDETLVAGGTLKMCADAGLKTVLICLTRGERGSISDVNLVARENLGSVRESELRAAGEKLGAAKVECFNYPDGELPWVDKREIENVLIERIRHWQPEIVITFGPEGLYWHPDHIAVYELTTAALSFLKKEGFSPWTYYATFPEGYISELVKRLESRKLNLNAWGLNPGAFGAPLSTITTRLDVRHFLDAKLDALHCHQTQFAADNLFYSLPRDLADEYLGYEYFVKANPTDSAQDKLAEIVNEFSTAQI